MTTSPILRRGPAFTSALVTALCLAAPLTAGGQEPPDTIPLDPIVVTATKLPTARRAVPASVTVLDGVALRLAGVRDVADALRSVPGLYVARSGSVGGLTSLFVRGAESDHVQVLIDGVPVNDPGGTIDLANLTMADVERIEVVRGPASVLYGTDAAAGVVQIFTRRGDGTGRLETTLGASRAGRVGPGAEGGSSGFDVAATVSGGSSRSQWGFTAARADAAGAYAVNNQFENTTITGGFRLQPSEATAISVSLRRGDGRFHFPTDGGGALVDANQFRRSETLASAIEAGHTFGPGIDVQASLTSHAADHLIDDAPDGPADTIGFFASRVADTFRRQRVDVHANIRSGRTIVTFGAAAEAQRGESNVVSSSSFGPFEDSSENKRSSRAGYLQLVTVPRSGFTVTGGTRLEHSNRFGSLATWRVGVNLHGADGGIRLAAGSGFKEPTFYENFATGFVRGNPGLEPERTRSAELGLERTMGNGRFRVEATVFLQQLRNLIQYTAEPPSAGASNYFNVGEARTSGLELAVGLDPVGTLGFDFALTLLRTRVTDAGFGADRAFLQDQRLLRRPAVQADLRTNWRPAVGLFSLDLTAVGHRDDLDFSDPTEFAGVRVSTPAHALVGVAFERTLVRRGDGQRIGLRLRADNIFDRRYEEIRNFPAPRRTVGIAVTAVTGF